MALQKDTVTGTVRDDQNDPIPKAIVICRLTRPDKDGALVVPDKEETRADDNGNWSLDLWPNTRGETNSKYRVIIRNPKTGEYLVYGYMVVPEGGGTFANLVDLNTNPEPLAAWRSVSQARVARDTADNHATTSQRFASEDDDTTVVDADTGNDTGTYSSRHHRHYAEAARDDSEEHKQTSKRWATETNSTVVDADSGSDSGEYSSKEYAQGTQSGTGGSAKDWAQKTAAAVVSGLYAAKEWAIGTLTRGTSGGGSARDWATLTGQTVDDTEYGAAEYAHGDVEGHGGAAKAWAIDASSPDASGDKSAKTLAGEASTSASNAATSESNAATSESNASTSASNAATSESNAQSHLDDFEDVYWNAHSSEPSSDPNGNGPDDGDLYFNTNEGKLKVYNGGWQDAAVDETTVVFIDGSNAMAADLALGGYRVVNLASPTNPSDAANKDYVDAAINGLDWQESVIDQQGRPPSSPSAGNRYLASYIAHAIVGVDTTNEEFEVGGDHRGDFADGDALTVNASTGNDATYTVSGAPSYDSTNDITIIAVAEDVTDSTADGEVRITVGAWNGHRDEIAEYDGSAWTFVVPDEDTGVIREADDTALIWNSTSWVNFGSTVKHNVTQNLQGGASGEYYHLPQADHDALTDANAQLPALQSDGSPAFAGLTVGGSRGLTTADEGSGNGLDADTVDGVHDADIEERSFILALLF